MRKDITSWEKAMYYFAVQTAGNKKRYSHVWFFEDDVFIPTESTIPDLDRQFPESDLLSNTCGKTSVVCLEEWHWSKIQIPFSPPYFTGMMCIVRVSAMFLSKIKEYAQQERTLFFLEAMFPSLAYHFNLIHDYPPEFAQVLYRHDFQPNDILPTHLYHPIKDLTQHVFFREQLDRSAKEKGDERSFPSGEEHEKIDCLDDVGAQHVFEEPRALVPVPGCGSDDGIIHHGIHTELQDDI
jgi:hypothetical protein